MWETLQLEPDADGAIWPHATSAAPRQSHQHAELELNLVCSGSARYLIDGSAHPLFGGTLIWLFPDQVHLLMDESPDFFMWIVVLKQRLLSRLCKLPRHAPLRSSGNPAVLASRISQARADDLDRMFRQMSHGETDGGLDWRNAALGYALLRCWNEHLAGSAAAAAPPVHPAVGRCARLLRQELDPGKLSVLAKRCGLSPSRLSRLFKQQTGISLVKYRQQLCLQRLLEQTAGKAPSNLLAAALRAGFGSYPQFHRVFKAQYGVGPGHYFHAPS